MQHQRTRRTTSPARQPLPVTPQPRAIAAACAAALAAACALSVPAPAFAHGISGAATDTSTLGYLPLGIEHMLLGWDHLLFVLAIVLLSGSPRQAAKLISFFVAGHSLTLLLATVNECRVSPTAVDVVVALSIVFVAVIGLRGRPRDFLPVSLAIFAFGLVHGLGLSTRLQDLGIPDAGLVGKILVFNVGIEIGQFAAVAVMVGVIWLAARTPRWPQLRTGAFATLTAVGLIAAAVLSFPGGPKASPAPPGAAASSTSATPGPSPAATRRRSSSDPMSRHPPRTSDTSSPTASSSSATARTSPPPRSPSCGTGSPASTRRSSVPATRSRPSPSRPSPHSARCAATTSTPPQSNASPTTGSLSCARADRSAAMPPRRMANSSQCCPRSLTSSRTTIRWRDSSWPWESPRTTSTAPSSGATSPPRMISRGFQDWCTSPPATPSRRW